MAFRKFVYTLLGTSLSFATTSAHAADGVSPNAYPLFELPGGIPVTNAMVTSWVVSLLIIVVVRLLVKKPQMIPNGPQLVFETILNGVTSMIEPIVGKKMVKHALPLISCLFFFILIHNWTGLIPSVAAFGHYDEAGKFLYYFRPANSDLNHTIALATIAMAGWLFLVMRHAGLKVLLFDLFGNKANKKDTPTALYYGLVPVFFIVGIIEVISICIRPASLSLRLFGNIFGGENLLDKMLTMTPWFIPVAFPFYLFEFMVGFVQALVFALLVSVYIGLICNHEEEHH